ncbi:hypothetical protein MPTK1_2g16015 [Marchantia polymorpha subsp. ruderalis]
MKTCSFVNSVERTDSPVRPAEDFQESKIYGRETTSWASIVAIDWAFPSPFIRVASPLPRQIVERYIPIVWLELGAVIVVFVTSSDMAREV